MDIIFRKRKIIYFKPYEKKVGIWGMAKQLSMGWGVVALSSIIFAFKVLWKKSFEENRW